jgi:hypothetical protein
MKGELRYDEFLALVQRISGHRQSSMANQLTLEEVLP